jgi:ethanolamine utilization protein EutQ (cupin superfamily)
MPVIINSPSVIEAAGNKPKIIEEYFGRVNSSTDEVSIAKMKSPQGWVELGQRPAFNEYTLVLKGTLCVKTENELFEIKTGAAILTKKGEWIQYSTPYQDGAEYIAVCLPAFSSETVNRDNSE